MQSRPEEAPGCNGRFDVVVECAMPRDAERRRGYEGEIGNAGKFLRWGWAGRRNGRCLASHEALLSLAVVLVVMKLV